MDSVIKKENILMEVRRHPFIFYAGISWIFIFILIPLLTYGFIIDWLTKISGGHGLALFLFLYSIWMLWLWVSAFYNWTDYYLDVWMITKDKVIDIEQKGLFNREISTFRLDRVQDVTITIEGILATFIGFGDVHVQTAGDQKEFVIKQARNPRELKDTILTLIKDSDSNGL